MSLRVLSISTLFPNIARPGFGRFVASQMAALKAKGDVDLVMIAPIGLPPWPLSLREPYASLRKVPATSEWKGLGVHHPRFLTLPGLAESNPSRLADALLHLARKLHAEAPFDIVDAQFFFPDGPAAARIAQELGLPLSIKARGSDIEYWGTKPRARAQMLEAADQATLLLTVGNALGAAQVRLGMPGEKIAVHHTGIDHARFRPLGRSAARSKIGLDDAPLFVCPGALIAIKGQALAIEALAGIPEARLALAGSGPDEADLRALSARVGLTDRVLFLGQVSHDAMPLWLSAADAMVLPSEREGLANVWIEALACGTPIVIPDIGSAADIVTDANAGLLVERKPAHIAEALRTLLANPPSQEDVARHAVRFSWERNAAELAAHYRRIAAAK